MATTESFGAESVVKTHSPFNDKEIFMPKTLRCDKCRKPVTPANNLYELYDRLPGELGIMHLMIPNRHFLPELDDAGNVLCEGSPSTAQYIEGQPRDRRGYSYEDKREEEVRKAYKRLLADYPSSSPQRAAGQFLENIPGQGAVIRDGSGEVLQTMSITDGEALLRSVLTRR